MFLEIKLHVVFDLNHNVILYYSTLVQSQVIFFAHNTYFEDLPPELSLNSYKVGLIFDTYWRIRAKWSSWDGTRR